MNIQVKHIFVSVGHSFKGRHGMEALDYKMESRESVELVAGKGILGDRFFDFKPDFKGQVTFFDMAVYEKVKEEVVKGDLDPSSFRRSVLIEGVDLNALIGKRFTINGVEFTGSEECSPCHWMDEACAPGTEDFLKGRGGLRARILNDGELAVGEFELEVLGEVNGAS